MGSGLYKGYIETKDKQPLEKLKNRTTWKTLDDVRNCNGYGGVLDNDTILIDIDDGNQADIMMKMVESLNLCCRVYRTTRGRHFLFKNSQGQVTRNRTHAQLAVGLTADIKIGSRLSYEVIKINGKERQCEWDIDEGESYQEVPKWMLPVAAKADFIDMETGDGRNQALFNYILTLTANDFSVEETRETIRILNKYVLKEPLSDEELEVVLRDEAFQKPVFFVGQVFLFDKFAAYMNSNSHAVRVNNQLHIYQDGVYVNDWQYIESEMIKYIPNLRKTQRREVLDYMGLICDEGRTADARYIAFRNGIYDIMSDELKPFSSDIVITNKIPWDYVPGAYDELTDRTLDKLSCNDRAIRNLLEECVGYCFYRRNELGKSFVLTGDKSNGKSTFLDMLKNVLGDKNVSALDMQELGDRFSTSMMFGKLANIGDDIGDDFLQGTQVSIFKKIVTGNRIKAERKGQDPFEFNPYIKLLFATNNIPRMKDKTGAVLRRLIIIPFNATFSKSDADYDPYIKYKLIEQGATEYLIQLGIAGLKRVIANNEFTQSKKVDRELAEYEEENNPIVAFIEESGNMIANQPTNEVYKRYQVFCADAGMTPMSNIAFSRQLNKRLGLESAACRINGKVVKIFRKVQVEE